jgi:hypothetical protein
MAGGDVTQHLLGWMFYRQEPWSWPIGLVRSYGAPIPTSIVYTDSIPLLAVVFKLLRGLLPPVFQYIGLWALCCYLLQGVFGALLMRALGGDLFVQLTGAAFFILSPVMLDRLTIGHDTLAGHWLILAALWLTFRPADPRPWRETTAWGLLINLALWLHPYFWAMVLGLGLARVCQGWLLDRSLSRRHVEAFLAWAVCGLAAFYWLMGLSKIGAGVGDGGFGESSMNLNAPINPLGHSGLMRDLPVFAGQNEGFNYLGLGGILLAVTAVILLARRPASLATLKRHAALGACCLGLFAFALSNRVTLGEKLLFTMPLGPLERPCAVFRASGRFFWPVYYAIFCVAIGAIVSRVPKPWSRALLALALILQALDLSGSIAQAHARFSMFSSWHSPMQGPFWNEVGRRYKRIVVVPADHREVDYADLAYFAATRHMTINVGYLARYPQAKLTAYQDALMKDVRAGVFDPEAVYVMRGKEVAAIVRSHLRPGERMVLLDGHFIYMPGAPFPASALPEAP